MYFGRLAKSVWSRLKQLEKQTAFKSSVAQQLRDAEKEIIIIIVFTIRVSYIFTAIDKHDIKLLLRGYSGKGLNASDLFKVINVEVVDNCLRR